MIKLLFAGDFVPPENVENLFTDELQSVLKDKDFSIVNLETPLTNGNQKIEKTGNSFKRTPSVIKHIKDGLFDAVALSNNHIRDYGDEGVLDTIETCKRNNILTVGAGKDLSEAAKAMRLSLKGKKICILNYSEREFNIAGESIAGANPFDLIDAFYQIREEKEQSDFVMVIYHGGLENHSLPTPGLRKRLRFLVNVGADAIICHHTHVASSYEIYSGRPICYGLGNFCFDYKKLLNVELHQSLLARIIIDSDKVELQLSCVNYNRAEKKIELLKDKAQNIMLDKLKINNEVLQNDIDYMSYWNKVGEKLFPRYYIPMVYGRGVVAKLLRKLKYPFYNKKRLLSMNNLFSCDTHTEMISNTFSNRLNN
jgi:poly-gamma-glutamate synthesis protein (capsule biosynthesis protein)